MNCLLHQYNIMTPIFWLNLILLVMLHLEINTQTVHLFDPLEIEWKSSCPGTGLIANVDRLFLFGTGTNLSDSIIVWAPYAEFQKKSPGSQIWQRVCKISIDKCTDDNNTKCGCEQRGNKTYDFHLNVTVKPQMRQVSYRLNWIDSHYTLTRSEIRIIPPVWDTDYDFVNTVNETHALNSGNCELPFQPNTPFSYCINAIEKPYSIRIISWNISPSKIVLSEEISQHCVNTSGFSESGGILAYTELTGCQRQKSRYCSLKAAAEESPNACSEEEKQKGSVNLKLKNQRLDLSEEFCNFILKEDVNVSMTVCVLNKQAPYNVTIVLGDRVIELTNFSQDCVSLYHIPSAATFQPNYQFIFIDRCQNNVTLICKAILYAKEPPGRANDDEPSEETGTGESPGQTDDNDVTDEFAIIILGICIVLLSIMCFQMARLLLFPKKWRGKEDAVEENDEGDAPEMEYFGDVEYKTTKMPGRQYGSTRSPVDEGDAPEMEQVDDDMENEPSDGSDP